MVHYKENIYGDKKPYYDDTYLISVVIRTGKNSVKTIKQETKGNSIVEARALAVSLMKKAMKSHMNVDWAHILRGNPEQPSDKHSNVMYDNGRFYWIPNGKYGTAVPMDESGKLKSGGKSYMYWLYFDGKKGFSNATIIAKSDDEARLRAIRDFQKTGRTILFEKSNSVGGKIGKMTFGDDGHVFWTNMYGVQCTVNKIIGWLV